MISAIQSVTLAIFVGAALYSFEKGERLQISSMAFADDASAPVEGMTLAQNKKGAKKPATRERVVTREKIYRGDSRKIDFEATGLVGERKDAMGSMIGQNKANKQYDLVPVRLRWHDEMKQSTSSLENGRSGN